jgi:hypothetical protein
VLDTNNRDEAHRLICRYRLWGSSNRGNREAKVMRRVVFFLAVLVPIAMLVSGVTGSQASAQEEVIEQI